MLIQSFQKIAKLSPHRLLITFVDSLANDRVTFSFATLDKASDDQAHYLTNACGLNNGDRALMVYAPHPDFLVAFLGCLKAGIVPVPVAPPNPFNLENDLETLAAIAANAGAHVILSHGLYAQDTLLGAVARFSQSTGSSLGALSWYRTDEAPPVSLPFASASRSGDDVAFLLYTSGSTSLPKGVMLTFANLLHQFEAFRLSAAMGEDSRLVTWLPHYHGFNLILGVLSSISGNGSLWQISTPDFVQRPALWFDVMSRVRATHTAAPNFAFGLALKCTTPEQRAAWNLSSLRVILNAAEPIHLPTMRAFFAAFAASELAPSAHCPGYGLSESTGGVTVNGTGQVFADRDTLEKENRIVLVDESPVAAAFVGCGRPLKGTEVRIVHPEQGTTLAERLVGEVWVHSPSVAAGYFGLVDATEETFGGQLQGDHRRWLRTGDLGFLHEGEIYITGRLKDLIIVRGRNLYPNDVELAAYAASPVMKPGQVAAFSVPDTTVAGQEQIAVVAEVDPVEVSEETALAAIAALRQRVLQAFHVPAGPVWLVKPGAILRAPNGKIRRQPTRATLLNGELTAAAWKIDEPEVALADQVTKPAACEKMTQANFDGADVSASTGTRTENEIVDWLRQSFGRELKRVPSELDPNRKLADYAVDSLVAISILVGLEKWVGFQVSPSLFLEAPTIADVARVLVAGGGRVTSGEMRSADLPSRITLDSSIRVNGLPYASYSSPRSVLLTGATGFHGAFLVAELMRETEAEILCLVRAPDTAAGMKRLKQNLEHFGVWEPAMESRVKPVVGDLASEQLGLSDVSIIKLAERIDTIIHNGATVNWVHGYSTLESVNVRPLQTLLRIATTTKLKPLHFVSSLGVLNTPTPVAKPLLGEQDELDLFRGHFMGYLQTKWVCEKILAEAIARKIPVTIVRPPFIGGATDTGIYKTDNDIVAITIKGCIQMGLAPDTWGDMNILPVDYIARTVTLLSLRPEAIGRTFNLTHTASWPQVVQAIRDFGYSIDTVPYDKWIARVANIEPENALHSMKYLFATKLWGTDHTFADLYMPNNRHLCIDDRNVRAVLGESWPEQVQPVSTMVSNFLDYFVRSGFIDPPHSRAAPQ